MIGAPELDAAPEAVLRPRRRPGALPSHLSLPRQVAVIALWPMLEQLMASLVGFVDTALAGRLPTESIQSTNAVGVASYVVWLMGLFQEAVGVGATALIARAAGAGHRREANAAVGQSMLLALVWGVFIGAAFFIAAPWFGPLFGLRGRELELCTMYLRLLSAVAPCMSLLFIGAACLRGAGDFRSPFWVMVVVNAVNVVVGVLLVAGPRPIGGHGLLGIALGTVAAWVVGTVVMLALLIGKRGGVRLYPHRLRWQPVMTRRLVRISLPSLFENVAMWAGHAVVMVIVGRLGDMNLMGAHTIAIRIEAFSFLPGFALSLAAATMAGQYLGAGDPRTAERAVAVCWGYAAAIMTAMGVLFMMVPDFFVWLVTDKPVFTTVVPGLLFYAGLMQLGFATSMVLSGAMRGAGDTRMAMLLTLGTLFLVRVPAVWVVAMVLGYSINGIWAVMAAEMTLRGVAFLWRFRQGGWKRIAV